MMRRMLPWMLGAALIALLLTPFARDLYHRYRFNRELAQVSDPVSREALRQRYGSLTAVGDDLARHCEQIYGSRNSDCQRYRLSLSE